ncbi:MAG: hypothetical protein ABSD89_02610 [Halobacteriota archaeon]
MNTIIATPIPEMAEYSSRSGRRHALDLWQPKYVIRSAPDCTTRLRRARKQKTAIRATLITQPQYRDFEAREAFGLEVSPEKVY